MRQLRKWERENKLKWNPKTGQFIDINMNDNIRGPVYWVTVELVFKHETVTLVRRQPALTPSLAYRRTYNYYSRHFPQHCIQVSLVRRGNVQWDGWKALARAKGFPVQRSLLPKTQNPQPLIES